MAGQNFDITNDDNILSINSPKNSVRGPYRVVFTNLDERWAVVGMEWNGQPCLGIRWFWGNCGNPSSHGYPTWLVIPGMLSNSILDGLQLDPQFRTQIVDFLNDRIQGNEL